jgi:hypothetical protein
MLAFCIVALAVLSMAKLTPYNAAASSTDFSNANSALSSAYVATLSAQQKGGNISQLVSQLNVAISMYQKAQDENSTNPSGALSDLQNVIRMASNVTVQSSIISQAGASTVQLRDAVSVSSAVAVGIIAVLIYVFGGRIYRRLWFYLYKDYVVVGAKDG